MKKQLLAIIASLFAFVLISAPALATAAQQPKALPVSVGNPNHTEPKDFNSRVVTKDFRVSLTGTREFPKETLLRLFHLWQRQYTSPNGDTPVLPPDNTPALGKFITLEAINQPDGIRMFSAFRSGDTPPTLHLAYMGSELIAFKLASDRHLADDTEFYAYYFPSGALTFTNILKKRQTVRLFSEWSPDLIPNPGDLTEETFLKLIRDEKKRITVYDTETTNCTQCFGRAKIRGNHERYLWQHPDTWYNCPQCTSGQEVRPVKWNVRW